MSNTPPAKPRLWLQMFEAAAADSQGRREQLVSALRLGLRRGVLKLGERLPSTRVLAEDLGLSRVTVEAAYGQLEAEGYLSRKVGQGSFVAIASSQGEVSKLRSTLLPQAAALSRRGQLITATGGCDDPLQPRAFAAGSPDLRAFPLPLWRQLLNRRLRADASLLGYGDPQGHPALREAIAGYLCQSRGLRCGAEQVLVLTSSQQALQLCATLLLDAGDALWMEEPGYRGARTAFAAAGASIVPVPLDGEGLCPPAGAAAPRLIYLTPSHQYPCGMALSLPRRFELLALARQDPRCFIIEDDYDSEFHYEGRPMPALQGLDEAGRVLYVGTFSKVLFPSLRLAYLVLPEALVRPFTVARTVQDGHSAQLAQAVTADFISQGHFAAHLRLMRQLYRQRREVLQEALAAPALRWLRAQPSAGGLQLAALLPDGQEAACSRAAAARGIATPSLSALYAGTAAQDGWLLGYAALTPEEIRQAVAALATIGPHPGRRGGAR